jgi:hypothetical protein
MGFGGPACRGKRSSASALINDSDARLNSVTQIFVRTFYDCDQAFSIEFGSVLKKCVNNIAS